jgi:hypothetical protein
MHTEINTQFQLAANFVQLTNECVFITGKAGTGKTTFLKYIRANTQKNMAVIAPTGVAAINAGGVTMHSFFQLPFTPFIPSAIRGEFDLRTVHQEDKQAVDKHHLLGKIKLNREKRLLIQQLNTLIIDEISMVRCDTLDAIDTILKHIRNNNQPFGGVQMVFIGDMFQLPPVIPNDEWTLLQQFYSTPFFFSSMVLQQQPPVYIELEKIYRQTDTQFIELLNAVRNNKLTQQHHQLLQQLYKPHISNNALQNHIILTTHNFKAQQTNQQQLENLATEMFHFSAIVQGEFGNKSFPADELLQLKVGAKVMFIKNDTERIRKYYNGKLGVVVAIDEQEIEVQCADETDTIKVQKEKWENVKYQLNQRNQQIEEEVVGSFTQFPLRLAWAITIHKSQGLTFDRAIIDAGIAFAPGQVYVALSRCTSLQGIILQSPINNNSLHVDERIIAFSNSKANNATLTKNLEFAQQLYTEQLVYTLFNIKAVVNLVQEANTLFTEEHKKFTPQAAQLFYASIATAINNLVTVQEKFTKEIQQLFHQQNIHQLNQRLQKAAVYFTQHINTILQSIPQLNISTESKLMAQECNGIVTAIFNMLFTQKTLLQSIESNGINTTTYHTIKANLQIPPLGFDSYAISKKKYTNAAVNNPNLYQQLANYRNEFCKKEDLPLYFVAANAALVEMTNYLPQTQEDLLQITGFGKKKTEMYGNAFLEIIIAYCNEHNLQSAMPANSISNHKTERKEKTSKGASIDITLSMLLEGKTMQQIATDRNLAPSTIEGHAALLLKDKKIDIEQVLGSQKLQSLAAIFYNVKNYTNLVELKALAGEDFSYGEIRCYVNWFQIERIPNTNDIIEE